MSEPITPWGSLPTDERDPNYGRVCGLCRAPLRAGERTFHQCAPRTLTMLAVELVEALDRAALDVATRALGAGRREGDIVAAKNARAAAWLSHHALELAGTGRRAFAELQELTESNDLGELVLLVSELRRERDRLAARNRVLEERVQKAIGTLGGKT